MNAGRPKKPKAQKIIDGTYRKDRDVDIIKAKTVNTLLEAPEYLTETAKTYFNNICTALIDMNNLSNADIAVIVHLAETIELHAESYRLVSAGQWEQQTQSGYSQITAAFTVWEKTGKRLIELSSLLGLSPAARERIKIKPKEEENDILKELGI